MRAFLAASLGILPAEDDAVLGGILVSLRFSLSDFFLYVLSIYIVYIYIVCMYLLFNVQSVICTKM